GTGYLQVVLSKKDVPEAAWEAFGRLTQETSLDVSGTVRADARAPGGVELTASDLKIIGPSVDFPITPKEHGTAFLFEHRHLWLRSRRQVAIARVRHEVVQAIRDFFYERHFTLVDTPILSGAIGERSEEHTSELQSRRDLVCRLLLEKKKDKKAREHSQASA